MGVGDTTVAAAGYPRRHHTDRFSIVQGVGLEQGIRGLGTVVLVAAEQSRDDRPPTHGLGTLELHLKGDRG